MTARTAPALSRPALWAAATVNELERSAAVVLSADTARELHLLVEHTDGLWTRLGADSPESALVNGSFERLTYSAADAWRLQLSVHCPVTIRLLID